MQRDDHFGAEGPGAPRAGEGDWEAPGSGAGEGDWKAPGSGAGEGEWKAPGSPDGWHRDLSERRLAGVCAGLARELGLPVVALRAAFVVATLLPGLHMAGAALYGALWLLMPATPGGASGLDRLLDGVAGLRELHDDWLESAPRAGRHPGGDEAPR